MRQRMLSMRLAACWLTVLCAVSSQPLASDPGDGIVLSLTHSPDQGSVDLTWSGGQGPYTIFRGADSRLLFEPANRIAMTSGTNWTDTSPPDTIIYYSVAGAGCAPSPETCDGIDNDCDQDIDEPGSETFCNVVNATGIECSSGLCTFAACDATWADCDGSEENGCETALDTHSNEPPGEPLGSHAADSIVGTFCNISQGCQLLLTREGIAGRYFSITALESSSCCAYLGLRFELLVPPLANYDLFITGGCSASPAFSSTGGPGQTETITVWCEDDCVGANDDFTANIEVRYAGGASCEPWTLRIYRREC